MCQEQELLRAIADSHKKYIEHGPRSTAKLKPLHSFWANCLRNIFGGEYEIHYLGENVKELTVEGKYYSKDIDITVTYQGKPIFCLGVKFVTSNLKQNINNYFENMMGETANIQRIDVPYVQSIVFRYKTPYYKKDVKNIKDKKASKFEIINEKDLKKYVNLAFDIQQAHRPFAIGIIIVDINEGTLEVSKVEPEMVFEKDFATLLQEKVSVANLCQEIENFAKFYKIQKYGFTDKKL
jgi:hypothetical protein